MLNRFMIGVTLAILASVTLADPASSYRRLVPLEGGSNFRDLGGYQTLDGRTVKRGQLFRSGAMASLTEADETYLGDFGFRTIVDLRSHEEIDLVPSSWAADADINVLSHDYSFMQLAEQIGDVAPAELYPRLVRMIEPQLRRYFDAAVKGEVPMVVNCSAGQDRTGLTSALMLLLLGVPEAVVLEDYLLSTDFRRPQFEQGGVDLKVAAKDNAFAAMMLKIKQESPHPERPNSLLAEDGTPLLSFALNDIRSKYGSVEAYAEKVLGIDENDIEQLRSRFLH